MALPTPAPPPHEPATPIGGHRRITIVTDYFPQDAGRDVHGAFQRLQRHIRSLQRIGQVDMIFLWPWGRGGWTAKCQTSLDSLPERWGLTGRIDMVNSSFTAQSGLFRILVPAALPRGLARRWIRRDQARVNSLGAILREGRPDLIFAHRMGAALPIMRHFAGTCPIVVDFDDVEHIRMRRVAKRAGQGQSRWRLNLAARLMRHLEREVLAGATVSLVCSAADAAFLRPLVPGAPVELLPNSSPSQEPLAPAPSPLAFFVGMARYWPNAEGLIWLAREVWPLVRRDLPAARLVLAGSGSDELGLANQALGIEALGFVPDLKALYGQARIALCPLRAASGTRIKIIEAAMYGRACLATAVGAEGLAFEDGKAIVLHDDPASFARACVELLADPDRATAIGRAAREVANRLYSQEALEQQLARICAQTADRNAI